jgi:arylsulfatase
MPEFAAPGLGRVSNHVRIDVEIGEGASGVLYAMGGASGGLTVYMDEGYLVYEYNMMIIELYSGRSAVPIPAGRHAIEVKTEIEGPGRSGVVSLLVDGESVGQVSLTRTVPGGFTATETFDVGTDLGSPVSATYDERRPFSFDGTIHSVEVSLL